MSEFSYLRPDKNMSAGQLSREIEDSLGYGTRIRIDPEKIWIQFESALTLDEKTMLDLLVVSHVVKPELNPDKEMADYIDANWEKNKMEVLKKAIKYMLGQPEIEVEPKTEKLGTRIYNFVMDTAKKVGNKVKSTIKRN